MIGMGFLFVMYLVLSVVRVQSYPSRAPEAACKAISPKLGHHGESLPIGNSPISLNISTFLPSGGYVPGHTYTSKNCLQMNIHRSYQYTILNFSGVVRVTALQGIAGTRETRIDSCWTIWKGHTDTTGLFWSKRVQMQWLGAFVVYN